MSQSPIHPSTQLQSNFLPSIDHQYIFNYPSSTSTSVTNPSIPPSTQLQFIHSYIHSVNHPSLIYSSIRSIIHHQLIHSSFHPSSRPLIGLTKASQQDAHKMHTLTHTPSFTVWYRLHLRVLRDLLPPATPPPLFFRPDSEHTHTHTIYMSTSALKVYT